VSITTGFDRDALLKEMIETATPIERVLIAYDHLEVLLERGEAAIIASHPAEVNRDLQAAQGVLSFLSVALDHENFEGASRIDQIYLYCWRRLIEANTHLDLQPLREVKGYIASLGAAFRAASALPSRS